MNQLLTLLAGSFFIFGTAQAAVENYNVDSDHSTVLFKVQHMGIGNIYGRFNTMTGSATFDAQDASKNHAKIEIKADSIDTNAKKRDQHLKSPDFFAAKQFPTIVFETTSLKTKGNGYIAKGKLTLHGVTKEIEAVITQVGEGEGPRKDFRKGFETKFTIKKSDFGMNYMGPALSDEIEVTVASEMIRQ